MLCTGSQGEPLSALARMANGEHRSLTITDKDTVIISATPIPGNEKGVQSIINSLSKVGCTIFDKSNALVHVSGHGSQEELKLMLAMVNPRYFAPVHGEAVHLRAHAKLAMDMGILPDHIFVIDNGDTLEMRNHKVRLGTPWTPAWSTSTACASPTPTLWCSATARSSPATASSPAW